MTDDQTGPAKPCATPGCETPRQSGESFCAEHSGKPGGKSNNPNQLLVCLVIAVVLLGIGWLWNAVTGGDKGDQLENAYVVCQQYVGDRLKSPGSADYSPMSATTMTKGRDVVTVKGWVDASNSFGAELRQPYTCKVRAVESGNWNGKWRLISLDLGSTTG